MWSSEPWDIHMSPVLKEEKWVSIKLLCKGLKCMPCGTVSDILWLEFCNSPLVGLLESIVSKLQRCQNMALYDSTYIITCIKKYQHITAVLKQLHWLPVVHHVHFKVLLVHCLQDPDGWTPYAMWQIYLTQYCRPWHALRSASEWHMLQEPRTCSTWGDCTFSKAGPVLWDSLPLIIQTAVSVTAFKKT